MPAPSTVPAEFALLRDRLATLTDPWFARGKVHPLPGVPALVVLGLPAGCRSPSAISRYGHDPRQFHLTSIFDGWREMVESLAPGSATIPTHRLSRLRALLRQVLPR